MPKKRKNQKSNCQVREDTRIAVNLTLKKLVTSEDRKELEFPSSYTAEERAYIHELARNLGLKSKSRGKGITRYVTVYKREGSTIIQADAIINLDKSSRLLIWNLIKKYPLDNKEKRDLLPPSEKEKSRDNESNASTKAMGRLNYNIPQVPQLKINYDVLGFRNSLSVTFKREDILQSIASNQVLIIAGETGCGKTTQIPQFILENSQFKNQPCRVICTQPRRISAVSVAERVAYERDEKVGQTFGYQIRLESRVAPKTLLTYCTNGVLLRTLMGDDSALSMITHIIVDEVHERDRFCDFLLIALRNALVKFPLLKVILMSATVDVNLFSKYFNNCPVIHIPGRMYNVEIFHLEDVLKITNYMTKEMSRKKNEALNNKDQCKILESWTQSKVDSKNKTMKTENKKNFEIDKEDVEKINYGLVPAKAELESWLAEEMDKALENAWLTGTDEIFTHILHLLYSEDISIDYQHSKTHVTPLMIAAGRGDLNIIEQLVNLGANLFLRSCNDWNALDWAVNMKQIECAELIEAYMKTHDYSGSSNELFQSEDNPLSEEDKLLLDIYHKTFNDDNIDYNLILALVVHIHLKEPLGAILIFLPGYDDIVSLKEKINNEGKMNQGNRFNLYILHSNMQTIDQKRVFKPSQPGIRKIILATNIAETSITINDVVYVIDSGKVKEKSFDALNGITMFQNNWISQACAKQRQGRAGRCQAGKCYRLCSSVRFKSLQNHATPEILRLPLQQLCLFAKQLAGSKTTIAEFLGKSLDPPPSIIIKNAIELLKTIDALDSWEDLTEMGTHLLDLPVEPRLGKMLLYAVVLKCLDPILTIVCILANKDPFILPSDPTRKQAAMGVRKEFAENSFSDHMTYLRAFQSWQNARANGSERQFCDRHFISAASMEMVVGSRSQLLGQLRASGFVKARGPGDIRDLNVNSENWAVVKAALLAGLYPNLIRVDREHFQLRTRKEVKVAFHPSSTLKEFSKSFKKPPSQQHASNVKVLPTDWLIYEEMSRAGRFCHAKTCTAINPVTVAIFSGPCRLPIEVISEAESMPESESDSEAEESREGITNLKLDDWLFFKVELEVAQLILHLRQKFNALLMRRMKNPNKAMCQQDEQIIKTLISVISNEELAWGLQQPLGIGQRPRPLLIDYYPANSRRADDDDSKTLSF